MIEGQGLGLGFRDWGLEFRVWSPCGFEEPRLLGGSRKWIFKKGFRKDSILAYGTGDGGCTF